MTERWPVKKTYKLFIGGAFPRSESGRTYEAQGQNVARGSRKDVREAVAALLADLDARGQVAFRARAVRQLNDLLQIEDLGCELVSVLISNLAWSAFQMNIRPAILLRVAKGFFEGRFRLRISRSKCNCRGPKHHE